MAHQLQNDLRWTPFAALRGRCSTCINLESLLFRISREGHIKIPLRNQLKIKRSVFNLWSVRDRRGLMAAKSEISFSLLFLRSESRVRIFALFSRSWITILAFGDIRRREHHKLWKADVRCLSRCFYICSGTPIVCVQWEFHLCVFISHLITRVMDSRTFKHNEQYVHWGYHRVKHRSQSLWMARWKHAKNQAFICWCLSASTIS